jgi:hypothetical protein
MDAAAELAEREKLAKALGQLLRLRHADVGDRTGRELHARRCGDSVPTDRYGRRALRVDVETDVSGGFRLEEFARHWRAT